MTTTKRMRFRLWHLFALVACAAITLWMSTQFGMETAEIEIVQFDTWPPPTADQIEAEQAVAKIVFQYVRPNELSRTRLNLFFGDSGFAKAKILEIGSRIKFRYRVKPVFWLKPTQPDPIAIRSIGLDPRDVEEMITEIGTPLEQ